MLWGTLELIVWLLQKNLPAIVVVVVYAKEIMALSRGKRLPSPHSFLPLIINTKGDGLETPWPVISTFFSHSYLSCPAFAAAFQVVFLQTCMLNACYHVFSQAFLGNWLGASSKFCSWEHLLFYVQFRLLMRMTPSSDWVIMTFHSVSPTVAFHPSNPPPPPLPQNRFLQTASCPSSNALTFYVN